MDSLQVSELGFLCLSLFLSVQALIFEAWRKGSCQMKRMPTLQKAARAVALLVAIDDGCVTMTNSAYPEVIMRPAAAVEPVAAEAAAPQPAQPVAVPPPAEQPAAEQPAAEPVGPVQ